MLSNCQSDTQTDEKRNCCAKHKTVTKLRCRQGHSENAPHRLEAKRRGGGVARKDKYKLAGGDALMGHTRTHPEHDG